MLEVVHSVDSRVSKGRTSASSDPLVPAAGAVVSSSDDSVISEEDTDGDEFDPRALSGLLSPPKAQEIACAGILRAAVMSSQLDTKISQRKFCGEINEFRKIIDKIRIPR
jgi:hypothetical protein